MKDKYNFKKQVHISNETFKNQIPKKDLKNTYTSAESCIFEALKLIIPLFIMIF